MPWEIKRKYKALLGNEDGYITKPAAGKCKVVLAYPNQYNVGMSNLGFHILYGIFNQDPRVVCERVFLPSPSDIEYLEKRRLPLFSLESQTDLNDFHVIAFSVAFENDCLNLLKILALAGIPLKRKERGGRRHPLILAGGIVPSFNPEPLSEFVDAFIIGEGEELIPELTPVLKELPVQETDAFLREISSIKGIYVPSAYRPAYDADGKVLNYRRSKGYPKKVEKRFVEDLDRYPASTMILTPNTEFGNMILAEVGRGCSRQCNFCVVGHLWNPYRNRSAEVIIKEAEKGLRRSKRIGLLGSAVCDHPHIKYIFKEINRMGGEVSTSSLQLDSLDEQLVPLLLRGGRKSLALAPEAGSQRLRRLAGKGFSDEKLLEKVRLLFSGGLLNIKLYFQVGLPTETDEDVEAISELTKRIKHVMLAIAKKRERLGAMTVSISPFVPKPGTPFQWEAMDDVRTLNNKIKRVKRGLSRVSNVNVIHDVPKYSLIQGMLARGDRRTGDLLLKALEYGGDWTAALKEINLNPDFYLLRRRGEDETFPWDHIDTGVAKEHLKKVHRL